MDPLKRYERQIGVIVPTHLDLGREILRGVRTWCTEHGGTRMVVISETGYHEGMQFPKKPLECLVVMYSIQSELEALRTHCPNLVVTSNREKVTGFARVLNDEEAIGRMGAEHLLGLGYRTFAFLSTGELQFAEEREAGFIRAVEAAGLPVQRFKAANSNEVARLLPGWLDVPDPVAVMAASDLHARWLIEALEDPLALIPDRLAILGVDNDSLQNALSPVPLSSVALSGERIGYEAAVLGMRLAAGEAVSAEPIRIAPKHVVSRRSTDALVIKDRSVARALRLMRERMTEFADAGDVIREIGVPRRTLEVKFRKHTGHTLAAELARARIRRAQELLSTTDLSIKEIAFLVGFSEPRMLTLVFRRLTKELPSEYRERVNPTAFK